MAEVFPYDRLFEEIQLRFPGLVDRVRSRNEDVLNEGVLWARNIGQLILIKSKPPELYACEDQRSWEEGEFRKLRSVVERLREKGYEPTSLSNLNHRFLWHPYGPRVRAFYDFSIGAREVADIIQGERVIRTSYDLIDRVYISFEPQERPFTRKG